MDIRFLIFKFVGGHVNSPAVFISTQADHKKFQLFCMCQVNHIGQFLKHVFTKFTVDSDHGRQHLWREKLQDAPVIAFFKVQLVQ